MARILVVDDEKIQQRCFQVMLDRENHEVISAHSGIEGVDLARQEKPDLIVMDLHMPEMMGVDAIREIRSFSKVPIIVCTSISSGQLYDDIYDAGADAFFIKPVDMSSLLNRIQVMLEQASVA